MPGLSLALQLTLAWGHPLFPALLELRDPLWVTPSHRPVSLRRPPAGTGVCPAARHSPARASVTALGVRVTPACPLPQGAQDGGMRDGSRDHPPGPCKAPSCWFTAAGTAPRGAGPGVLLEPQIPRTCFHKDWDPEIDEGGDPSLCPCHGMGSRNPLHSPIIAPSWVWGRWEWHWAPHHCADDQTSAVGHPARRRDHPTPPRLGKLRHGHGAVPGCPALGAAGGAKLAHPEVPAGTASSAEPCPRGRSRRGSPCTPRSPPHPPEGAGAQQGWGCRGYAPPQCHPQAWGHPLCPPCWGARKGC